MILAASAV